LSLIASRILIVLAQEEKNGYTDKTVIGGMDAFLLVWWKQSLSHINSKALSDRLKTKLPPSFCYSKATASERRAWAKEMINLLDNSDEKPPETTKVSTTVNIKAKRQTQPKSHYYNPSISLDSPITVLSGIANTMSVRFAKLGVRTIRDLLFFYPRRHLDYSNLSSIASLSDDREQTIIANIWEARLIILKGKRHTEAVLGDASGNMRAVWFNNPFVVRQMKPGDKVIISGRVKIFAGRPVFESPEWELCSDEEPINAGRLVPIYPLTSGLFQRQVRKLIKKTVDYFSYLLTETLPEDIILRNNLLSRAEAISQYHFPQSQSIKEKAHTRLAFEEFFLLQMGVMAKKRKWQKEQPGLPQTVNKTLHQKLIKSLPYTLTKAQTHVINEIHKDLTQKQAMLRLLQGDVGSGKTIVALSAMLTVISNSYQTALMAPTEILASQHFLGICELLKKLGTIESQSESIAVVSGITKKNITVGLFISDTKKSLKANHLKLLSSGEIDIAIGTHALIQKEVAFDKLAFVAIDEQHRFGVEQRSALRQKGFNPHMLIMTATPIPRTLALTIYGDLDLSVIDELPPGRQEIKTKWFAASQRDSVYRFIRKEILSGRQGFIICPLVEESDSIQAKAAVAEFERLSTQVFPDLRLSLLHGRMTANEKEKAMSSFYGKESDILVSTPVVEVGIDVPNATIMMIESADRFGLSQLHQFRGRVGRGEFQSYCILMSDSPSEIGRQRLDIIETTRDGFRLADEDLKLRGPGEFFGTRQSGIPDLRLAKLSDTRILESARAEATKLFEADPDLVSPIHKQLVAEINRVWGTKSGEWN